MGKNVIILGAGFSRDAGVPLMPQFVETMWHLAMTKRCRGENLSSTDCAVFANAMEVRNDLDRYHGRASFDDRNIEDILSILSFNVLSGSERAREQLATINKAIGRTIELTCGVKHPGIPQPEGRWSIVEAGPSDYRHFWNSLFKWYYAGNEMPTIITFNYDLVLERSLLQCLVSREFNLRDPRRSATHLRINYEYDHAPREIWTVDPCEYQGEGFTRHPGTYVQKLRADGSDVLNEIEILKLHGSVNFPREHLPKEVEYNIAAAVDDPLILPPIFNKISSQSFTGMWRTALRRMNEAHNIIVVGYSLPQTDIYMQYFLRAGVGPNLNLNDFFVFNPTLFSETAAASAMRERYSTCFSEQLRRRIQFQPSETGGHVAGTTEHFIDLLRSHPETILY